MRKLLLTTAILTLTALSGSAFASSSSEAALSQDEFAQVTKSVEVSWAVAGLHNGDYQSIAKKMNQTKLYDGAGSSLMVSVRTVRY